MISPDIVLRFLLGIIEPNKFGWDLISDPKFIEYANYLCNWITDPDKDTNIINAQYYTDKNKAMDYEVSRRTLTSSYNVHELSESAFSNFFSANSILSYITIFDYILSLGDSHSLIDVMNKYKQILKFVINNTTKETEEYTRDKLKELLVSREINFKNIRNSREIIPYNRLVDLLEFYNREEMFAWFKIKKIKYELIDFDIKFI